MANLQIDYIPVKDIQLDIRNPRVAPALEGAIETPKQEWIEMALGQYAPEDEERGTSTSYSSLKASIRAYKGLIHPIVVTPGSDGKFIVIEGNTRVAIFRELEKEDAPGDWKLIPAIKREVEEVGSMQFAFKHIWSGLDLGRHTQRQNIFMSYTRVRNYPSMKYWTSAEEMQKSAILKNISLRIQICRTITCR